VVQSLIFCLAGVDGRMYCSIGMMAVVQCCGAWLVSMITEHYVSVCLSLDYLSIVTYSDTTTHTQTDRQRDRETDRHNRWS